MSDSEWLAMVALTRTARRRGSTLAVTVNGSPVTALPDTPTWVVGAISTPAWTADGIDDAMADTFEAHAHDYLGSYESMIEAMSVAEAYVRAWKKNPRTAAKACGCQPIGAPRPTRARTPAKRRRPAAAAR